MKLQSKGTFLALIFFASLIGCGGGGGSSSARLVGGAIQGTPLNLSTEVTTLAGDWSETGDVNGLPPNARFNFPFGVTTDGSFLYVADSVNNEIRKIDIATGEVSLLAGAGPLNPGPGDGMGIDAQFTKPYGITTDGIYVYVADTYAHTIRQIQISTGQVSTLVGSGMPGSTDSVFGPAASFAFPQGITTDGFNLYVADTLNGLIRQIDLFSGAVSTLAVLGLMSLPSGITTDGINIYVADTGNHVIWQIDIFTKAVSPLAGNPGIFGFSDGDVAFSLFNSPMGITTDGSYLYVADTGNQRIRRIDFFSGMVNTLAGSVAAGHDDGTGTLAKFNNPAGITTDGKNLYVADFSNHEIRQIK